MMLNITLSGEQILHISLIFASAWVLVTLLAAYVRYLDRNGGGQ